MTNFTAGHEDRCDLIGSPRLDYPERHIEADNRLSWILGRLDQKYGKRAWYVHLTRDEEAVARSFEKRARAGIMEAYRKGILKRAQAGVTAYQIALDYIATVEANISLFLRDKPNVIDVRLEHAAEDFAAFWSWIGARGNKAAALAEWQIRHNASPRYLSPAERT
jgi:hypothetical protein